jgi:hypothetical protein
MPDFAPAFFVKKAFFSLCFFEFTHFNIFLD